jgi:ribonuclease-3 family protein
MNPFDPLKASSVRTLAWLGDAEYEREVRFRLAKTGDWSTDALDKIRAKLSSAAFQAEMLEAIGDQLSEDEKALARRGRNANVRSNGRVTRDVKTYRQATAFEALMAKWMLGNAIDNARFHEIVAPRLQQAIDEAIAKLRNH